MPQPERNKSIDDPALAESVWSLAAFWLVAFTAAGLFAAVLLAPKWEAKRLLRQRVTAMAAQCAYLNDSNEHLRRVIEAFEHDPEFTAELARFELDYSESGEERIPAPIRHWERPKPSQAIAEVDPFWTPFIRTFAHDRVVRHAALGTAAIFMIVSIAFFRPARES
jgi:cell division protein FtsB